LIPTARFLWYSLPIASIPRGKTRNISRSGWPSTMRLCRRSDWHRSPRPRRIA